jgi:hypothetical protein
MEKTTPQDQIEFSENHLEELSKLVGVSPKSELWRKKIRTHQGWWRAFVLGVPQGEYLDRKNKIWKKVCNRVFEETSSEDINFVSESAAKAVKKTLEKREMVSSGIVDESRLRYNLLSSQPLCFNFFGELDEDHDFGLKVLQTWWPDCSKLNQVFFEFAPKTIDSDDNSAFDIAFEVERGNKVGIIGLECKYTDSFSFKPQKSKVFYGDIGSKGHDRYLEIFEGSRESFSNDYYEYVRDKEINQLFRNQLIAERVIQNPKLKYDFVKTGLFCFEGDKAAIKSGYKLKSMLTDSEGFQVITYHDFIEAVQKLDLDWKRREWSMLLWTRYCALSLSDAVYQKMKQEQK